MRPDHRRRRSEQRNDMCSSSAPAAAASAHQSFQIASVHPPSSRQTAPTRTSDDGKPPAVQDDGTIHTTTNSSTAMAAAAASSYEEPPLLTLTAPLNDVPRGGHSGTYRQNIQNIHTASTAAAAAAQAHNPAPTTTILPPTKRPADGSSDALLDDLERWCHRQFGTAFASSSATAAAASAGGEGGRKRRRTATTTSTTNDIGGVGAAGNNPFQMPPVQMAQHVPQLPQVQTQPQPAQAPPSAHSLTTSPSSLTPRKTLAKHRPTSTSTSFADLLQLLDAHELKEAIATGSVFDDDLAAQSAIPGLAPYAADVWGDRSGLGLGLGGWMGGQSGSSSSSLLAYDDLLAGMTMEVAGDHPPHHHQVKMPSSIAGSVVQGSGAAPCGSGRSTQNDHPTASTQPQLPPATSCAYEMMTSDVSLPAETREELRVAYPSSLSFMEPSYPGQMYHHQHQQQQQAPQGMMPTASVDEVTPRASNVRTAPTNTIHAHASSAYPTQYNNTPQDYHQPLAAPPPPQLQAPAASQYRFLESLEFSTQSERLLREWDRSMGLKACHSKTMLRTSKSRKKLLEKVGNVTALMYLNPAAVGGGSQYGSRHGSMVGSYPPGAYPGVARAMGCATASAHTAEQKKKEGGATGAVMGSKSSSHDSFQDQIEKNSQTATMA